MADALTPLFAVAAVVLGVAGVAKLRAPGAAAEAVDVPATLIRAFSLVELGLGVWGLIAPARLGAIVIAAVYLGFAGVNLVLAGRHEPCGCFGEQEQPTSGVQSILSAALAVVAGLAAGWTPHGISWLVARSPVTLIAIAGAAYAAVVAYTLLPAAWSAWEGGAR